MLAPSRIDSFGQRCDSRRLQKCPQVQADAERFTDARRDLSGEQLMTAEVKKIILGTDPFDTEHFGKHLGKTLLHRRAWRG